FLLLFILYLISTPFLALLAFKKKYSHSIPERFFLKNFGLEFSPTYWFHTCSFGESKSFEPILKALLQRESHAKILLTCTTNTGFAYLKTFQEQYPQNFIIHYLPFEIFLPFYRPFLKHLKTLIVTEAELWKMLFWVAKNAGAKTLLLNARISDRSLKSYMRMRWFYSTLFSLVDEVLAQSEVDKERLENLGAKNVSSFGNLKIFSTPQITQHYTKKRDVILCASSHKDEERLVLESFLPLSLDTTLIIVPRHPERFSEVQSLCEQECKKYQKTFSTFKQEWGDVVLVNAMGELNNFYAIADCVILCGSFAPIGGHNPLEPAFFHAPILSGKHIYNQNALFSLIEGYELIESQELKEKLQNYKTLPHSYIKESESKFDELIALIQK
ncbi:lipid IV(A) 3-deoxy-D-manno-octulosonic acid transferase, partial [uncultured Helicobacter sp.]|uniref:lipid IV(A) 3-deoxy-D-manno-octulosonic acid transferase n=1 Tax=uncultured Helicobacter sp. TaxID=175537 RepID=UPI0026327387